MKVILFSLALVGILALNTINANAQDTKEIAQTQKEVRKYTKEQLNAKASKEAKTGITKWKTPFAERE